MDLARVKDVTKNPTPEDRVLLTLHVTRAVRNRLRMIALKHQIPLRELVLRGIQLQLKAFRQDAEAE